MRKSTRRRSRRLCAVMSLAAISACGTLSKATTYNWTGNGADPNFSDQNNWDVGSGYPGSNAGTGDIAVFGSSVTSNQPSLDINDSIGELIFQSISGGWILGTTSSGSSGNVLTLNGASNGFGIDATAQTSGLTDIQANLAVGAAQTWAVGTGGTLEIDGFVSGSSALTVGSSGATGTIVLTTLSNAFTGAVTIASGTTLQLGGGTVIPGDGMLGGPIALTDSTSVLTFNETAAETYTGLLSGPAGSTLNNNGTGALTFTALSTGFLGTTNLASGATLQLGSGSSGNDGMLGGPIALASSSSVLTFDEFAAETYGGLLIGPSGSTLNQNGPGAVTLISLSTGFLGTIKIAAGATFQLGNGNSGSDGLVGGPIAITTSGILTFDEHSAESYGGSITSTSSAATLNDNGGGAVTLTALNTGFTGTTKIATGATLQLGNGSSGSDGNLGGPISITTTGILNFDEYSTETYSGLITSSSSASTVNDKGAGTVILTASSTGFTGTANISGGATLQLGNGTTAGNFAGAATIALASGTSPLSTLTLDEPTNTIISSVITGPSGSIVNDNGPTGGATVLIENLNPNFAGTVKVQAKQTLQLGNATSSTADGLFGSSTKIPTIALQASTSVLTFDEDSGRTFYGAISGPASSTINISGPTAGVITTLANLNPSFVGTVNVSGADGLQLGTNASSSTDGNFGAATVNVSATSSSSTNLYINNAGNETLPFTINATSYSGSYVVYINFNGSGTEKMSGTVNLLGSNDYLIFNGGPVNVTGSVNASTNDNSEYFYDRTNSAITLSNASNPFEYAPKFYMQAINGATAFTNENVTLASGATLTGSSFAVISNDNNNAASPYTSSQLPPPVVFNDNGTITTPTLYVNYNSASTTAAIGQTTLNISGTSSKPASVVGNIYTGYNTDTLNSATSTINIGAYGSNTSTTSPVKEQFSLDLGSYAYITVGGTNAAISALPASGGTGLFYLGDAGDAFMEIGNGGTVTVNDGSAATNSYATGGYGLVVAEANSGATAVVNVYTGGTLNYTPSNTGDNNFFIGTTSGQTGVINVIGGKVNNQGNNSPITIGGTTGVNGQLNIDSDSSGNAGLVIASYIRSTTNNTTSFLNFNGGELEYSDVANGPQSTFINSALSGYVYVFANGATIGTNASANAGPTVTIPVALQAPSGKGVTSITVTNSSTDTGYTAPPLVQITGGGGKDAAAYATINASGQITAVIVTSPGFGYTSAPTVTFIDGGAPINGNGAAYTFTAATATATIGTDATTGGLTKVDSGTLILSASNTYGGPTQINQGTLQFTGASNSTNAVTVLTTSSGNAANLYVSNANNNNNIASAATILVGDIPAATGQTVGSFTIGNTAANGFILNPTAVSSSAGQTLGGFGIVTGSSSLGLTIGNQTVVAPGTGSGQAVQSLTATPGSYTTTGTNTALFNTGNKGNATGTATGALTIGNQTGTITTFAGGGTYYWKLNMNTGGSGVTTTPGMVPIGGGDVSGANWDALILDGLNVTATPTNAFTIQAVGFTPSGTASNPVTIGTSNDPYYSWTIARVGGTNGNPPDLSGILANLSLNTSGLPAPAPGYSYYLTTQQDPQIASDSDIVMNYSPVPEPSSALLLASAAGLLIRRRRRSTIAAT